MTARMMMGNRNVEALLWAQPPVDSIPPAAFRMLLLMAKRAHDDEPLYYGGITHLTLNMPGLPGPAKRRAAMRYLAALQAAGLVVPTEKRVGHRMVYELHIPGVWAPVDNP